MAVRYDIRFIPDKYELLRYGPVWGFYRLSGLSGIPMSSYRAISKQRISNGLKVDARTYSKIAYDERISHGAFRLWHILKDRTGANDCAWPGMRRIKQDLHSGATQIGEWIKQLVSAGYIRVDKGNVRRTTKYYVLDLFPKPEIPVPNSDKRVTGIGNETNLTRNLLKELIERKESILARASYDAFGPIKGTLNEGDRMQLKDINAQIKQLRGIA